MILGTVILLILILYIFYCYYRDNNNIKIKGIKYKKISSDKKIVSGATKFTPDFIAFSLSLSWLCL